ncbi:MAG: NAD-dependent epimerase/dehydratase family protein [Mycobacterium sp.]
MKVLVTGGAGSVGSHLAAACAAAGWEVTATDSLTDSYSHAINRQHLAMLASNAGLDALRGGH